MTSSPKVFVIIPAHDEEQAIAKVLAEIPRSMVDEIIVADNGSTDRTAHLARAAGATVVSEPRRGYGHACLAGIRHASDRNPDVIVFLDGDYSDYPEDLPDLLAKINEGNDLVIIKIVIQGGCLIEAFGKGRVKIKELLVKRMSFVRE